MFQLFKGLYEALRRSLTQGKRLTYRMTFSTHNLENILAKIETIVDYTCKRQHLLLPLKRANRLKALGLL